MPKNLVFFLWGFGFMSYYHIGCKCTKKYGLVATKICVRAKCSKQGSKIGAAIEDVDNIGGCDVFKVENCCEIHQEVG